MIRCNFKSLLIGVLVGMLIASLTIYAGQQKFSAKAIDDSVIAQLMAGKYSEKDIAAYLALPLAATNVDVDAARWMSGPQRWHTADLKVALAFDFPKVQGETIYDKRGNN